ASGSTFQCQDVFGSNIDSTNFGAWSSGGTVAPIVELATPWAEADLPLLRWAQSSNTLYVVHPNYQPQLITRTSTLVFTCGGLVATDGPYDDVNKTSTTFTASGTTGSVTLTASATTGVNGGAGFQSGDVGRLVRIGNSANPATSWGYGQITAVASTTSATLNILSAVP